MGDAPNLADGTTEALGGFTQNIQAIVPTGLDQVAGQLELKLDGNQQLTDAVMQFAGDPRAFFFLQADDALVESLELFVGQAMFADVQCHAADKHQQHGNQRDGGDCQHGAVDTLGDFIAGLLGGLLDVFEVDTSAEHPAPTVQHHHVGELVGDRAGRGFFPGVTLETGAGFCAFQQGLNHRQTVRVGHVPKVFADQLGLPRVHQAATLAVINEEVTVDAEAEFAQFFEHALLCHFVTLAIGIQRLDQALGHFYVVFQLRAFTGEDAVFDQLRLLFAELSILDDDQRANNRNRQDQRQDTEGNNFVFELHIYSCPDRATVRQGRWRVSWWGHDRPKRPSLRQRKEPSD